MAGFYSLFVKKGFVSLQFGVIHEYTVMLSLLKDEFYMTCWNIRLHEIPHGALGINLLLIEVLTHSLF